LPCLAVLSVLSAASSPCPDLNLIHYTTEPLQKIPFPQQPKTHVWVSAVRERRILQRSAFASTEFKSFYIDFIFCISRFLPVSF